MGLFKTLLNKSVKNVETATKALEKAQTEMAELQEQQSELSGSKGKLNNAMNVIEASLIIDGADKNALKQKEKATAKIEAIEKQLLGLAGKKEKAQEAISKANKELSTSRGEVFKGERVRETIELTVAKKLADDFKKIEEKHHYKGYNQVEWGQAYGFPIRSVETPSGAVQLHLANPDEASPFIVEKQSEVDGEAKKKAQEITDKINKYANELMQEEGFELIK